MQGLLNPPFEGVLLGADTGGCYQKGEISAQIKTAAFKCQGRSLLTGRCATGRIIAI